MLRQIVHFLLHLRLHYQFFILSGGYLLGGLLAGQMDTSHFWLQFLNVHILLYGGATAFNSFWDKDDGPIGGLKNPPKMTPWMRPVSIIMMLLGWIWSFDVGVSFFWVYGFSLLLFWLYSTPVARWKGHPILSLIAIGVSTGTNSVLLGTLAAGGSFSWIAIFGAIGAGAILLSLYPVSQIYQTDADKQRGDRTFAIAYGLRGVRVFFWIMYLFGLILISYSLYQQFQVPAVVLFITGLTTWFFLIRNIYALKGMQSEYSTVMRIKFFTSLSFVLYLIISNALLYDWISIPFLQSFFK